MVKKYNEGKIAFSDKISIADFLRLVDKVEQLEQSITNVDAKYKFMYNEIMLMYEKDGSNHVSKNNK